MAQLRLLIPACTGMTCLVIFYETIKIALAIGSSLLYTGGVFSYLVLIWKWPICPISERTLFVGNGKQERFSKWMKVVSLYRAPIH